MQCRNMYMTIMPFGAELHDVIWACSVCRGLHHCMAVLKLRLGLFAMPPRNILFLKCLPGWTQSQTMIAQQITVSWSSQWINNQRDSFWSIINPRDIYAVHLHLLFALCGDWSCSRCRFVSAAMQVAFLVVVSSQLNEYAYNVVQADRDKRLAVVWFSILAVIVVWWTCRFCMAALCVMLQVFEMSVMSQRRTFLKCCIAIKLCFVCIWYCWRAKLANTKSLSSTSIENKSSPIVDSRCLNYMTCLREFVLLQEN